MCMRIYGGGKKKKQLPCWIFHDPFFTFMHCDFFFSAFSSLESIFQASHSVAECCHVRVIPVEWAVCCRGLGQQGVTCVCLLCKWLMTAAQVMTFGVRMIVTFERPSSSQLSNWEGRCDFFTQNLTPQQMFSSSALLLLMLLPWIRTCSGHKTISMHTFNCQPWDVTVISLFYLSTCKSSRARDTWENVETETGFKAVAQNH